jgi:hypothetical protein
LIVVLALDLVTEVLASTLLLSKTLKIHNVTFLLLSVEPVIHLDLLIVPSDPRNLFHPNLVILFKLSKRILGQLTGLKNVNFKQVPRLVAFFIHITTFLQDVEWSIMFQVSLLTRKALV